MAIGTGYGAMRPNKRKVCLRVIEFGQIFPLLCRMAGEASQGLSQCVRKCHALGELPLMNVLVATGTGERAEVVKRDPGAK